jgi:hypothetical protein
MGRDSSTACPEKSCRTPLLTLKIGLTRLQTIGQPTARVSQLLKQPVMSFPSCFCRESCAASLVGMRRTQ